VPKHGLAISRQGTPVRMAPVLSKVLQIILKG
jgi:hypothetical protein